MSERATQMEGMGLGRKKEARKGEGIKEANLV